MLVRDEQGKIVATLSSGEDITDRTRAETQARSRLERPTALHSIDMVTGASLDPRMTQREFINRVTARMRVDAADRADRTAMLQSSLREHFRSLSGIHLDPKVGEVFLANFA